MTLVSLFCCCEVGVGELDVNVACGVSSLWCAICSGYGDNGSQRGYQSSGIKTGTVGGFADGGSVRLCAAVHCRCGTLRFLFAEAQWRWARALWLRKE